MWACATVRACGMRPRVKVKKVRGWPHGTRQKGNRSKRVSVVSSSDAMAGTPGVRSVCRAQCDGVARTLLSHDHENSTSRSRIGQLSPAERTESL